MEKCIAEANRVCNNAMHSLFQATYYMGKEIISLHKFPSLCSLFVKVKANMTEKLYYDEKNCGKILICISLMVQNKR